MNDWICGMDVSTLLEVEECGGRFSDKGAPGDAMEILHRHGMNLVRLRLWNDPYDEDGSPYGAGCCDLKRVTRLAARAQGLGLPWLLDFHYSDFWADPGKQTIPKAWQGLDETGLEKAVYQYTFSVMVKLMQAGLPPAMVSVGNELTNGLLWPRGKVPDFGNIARLVGAGIRAVRAAEDAIPVMIHLDNGGNNALYREWFDRYFACGGLDFEYIGLSYYPFWHGSMADLRENLHDLALRYHKDLVVAETSTGFTLDDYAQYEKLSERKGMAANPALAARIPYAMTPAGQCKFLRDLAGVLHRVPEGRGKGFIYWEPAWIPVPGSGWATEAALRYTGEKGPGGNEWANQALFDYEGRALPAVHILSEL